MPYPFSLAEEGTIINTLYIQEISKIYEYQVYENDNKTPFPVFKYYITMNNGKTYTQSFDSEYKAKTNRSELIGLLRP